MKTQLLKNIFNLAKRQLVLSDLHVYIFVAKKAELIAIAPPTSTLAGQGQVVRHKDNFQKNGNIQQLLVLKRGASPGEAVMFPVLVVEEIPWLGQVCLMQYLKHLYFKFWFLFIWI